jgi:hypothetical protein
MPKSMRVLVDGKALFERVGEWANIDAPAAIGPLSPTRIRFRKFCYTL